MYHQKNEIELDVIRYFKEFRNAHVYNDELLARGQLLLHQVRELDKEYSGRYAMFIELLTEIVVVITTTMKTLNAMEKKIAN